MSETNTTPHAVIDLPATLDLVSVGPLRDVLLQHRGGPAELVCDKIERIGGLGLQILLAAHEAWASDGQPFVLTHLSPALKEMLATLGAHDLADADEEPST